MRSWIPVMLLAALPLACGPEASSPADTTVAVVNGLPISLAQYQRSYQDYLFSGGLEDQPMRRSAYLNRMIAVELISAEAREEGIEQTDDYIEERERMRQKMLIEAYLADEVFAHVEVTEQDLVEQFVRVNTQMTARHLFAPTESQAEALHHRLQAGESFEDLAREVFADPVLAESGGLVGTFGFDEMDQAFENAAFSMRVGDVSRPVRTSQGWSVIKLEDRFSKPVMTESEFAEKRNELAVFVRQRKENQARRDFLDRLVEESDVRIDPEYAAVMMGQSALAPEASRPMITFEADGGATSWTDDEMREAARFTSDRQRRSVDNALDLQAFVAGLVARSIILERAESAGMGRDSRVRQGLDAAMSEWIYDRAFEQVLAGMSVPEGDVRTYFDTYSEEFSLPRRARISEIVTASSLDAEALKQEAARTSFEALARRRSLRPETAAKGGRLGLFTEEELGPWGDDVFSARPGDVIGPLATTGKYLILRVDGFQEARAATFEEARDQAEAMLRRERQQEYLREYVQQLRARYPVRIEIESPDELPLSGSAHA